MIIITGQTATGKTNLALEYARKYNGELVNFDSRQIYKYLDIITGKDLDINSKFKIQNSKLNNNFSIGYYEIDKIKIWLYDIVYPDQYFSSFEYVQIAKKVIENIKKKGKTPILVGGTYFYLKHLLYGFDFQVPPNFQLREKLNKKSVKELQKILISLQGQSLSRTVLNKSDWQNPRRLIRRIEILMAKSHQKISTTPTTPIPSKPSTPLKPQQFIGLRYANKDNLRQAIKKRVEKRLKEGAIDEVKKIFELGYKKTDPGLQTIGYKQIIDYLEGKISKEKAIENWITAEIHYAKRQYTFMKKDPNIYWKEI